MTIDAPRCPALHPDLPYARCVRREGHGTHHATFTDLEWENTMHPDGRLTWNNRDDAAGGVTAAAIEQEAEGIPFSEHLGKLSIASHRTQQAEKDAAHFRTLAKKAESKLEDALLRACPDPDAHWRLDEAVDRAERAERERDEARKFATAEHVRATEAEQERDRAVRERNAAIDNALEQQPRTLTADDVDDAMVRRGMDEAAAWQSSDGIGENALRFIITAALTPGPPRPHGAEELQALIQEVDAGSVDTHKAQRIADYLAERGVLPPLTDKTNPEEQS